MKFFNIFRKSEKAVSTDTKKKNNVRRKKQKAVVEEPVVEPPNIQRAKSLIESWRNHSDAATKLEQFSPKAKVVFEDIPPLSAQTFSEVGANVLLPSFPDIDWTYKSISVVDGNPKVISVDDIVCFGTHTGAPFSVGGLPPIARTNKKCVNDPERLYIHLDDDNKIKKLEIISLGNASGLMGFYEQIQEAAE